MKKNITITAVEVTAVEVPAVEVPAVADVSVQVKALLTAVVSLEKQDKSATSKAVSLMIACGYDELLDHIANGVAFKAAKSATKTMLESTLAPFSVKGEYPVDSKEYLAEKRYNTCVSLMSRACKVGLNRDKPASGGDVTGSKTAITRKGGTVDEKGTPDATNAVDVPATTGGDVVEKLQERKPIKISADAMDNLTCVYEFTGDIRAMWDKFSLELLDLIAITPEIQSDIAFRLSLGK